MYKKLMPVIVALLMISIMLSAPISVAAPQLTEVNIIKLPDLPPNVALEVLSVVNSKVDGKIRMVCAVSDENVYDILVRVENVKSSEYPKTLMIDDTLHLEVVIINEKVQIIPLKPKLLDRQVKIEIIEEYENILDLRSVAKVIKKSEYSNRILTLRVSGLDCGWVYHEYWIEAYNVLGWTLWKLVSGGDFYLCNNQVLDIVDKSWAGAWYSWYTTYFHSYPQIYGGGGVGEINAYAIFECTWPKDRWAAWSMVEVFGDGGWAGNSDARAV
jgi:hypothetical protein